MKASAFVDAHAIARPSMLHPVNATALIKLGPSQEGGWEAEYAKATDAFTFIKLAAHFAILGDARAAFYVGQVALRCSQVVHPVQQEIADSDANYDGTISQTGTRARHESELLEDTPNKQGDMLFCRRYAHENAFSDLPPIRGGYMAPNVWLSKAYLGGDPLAAAVHARIAIASANAVRNVPGDACDVLMGQAQSDVLLALSSGNPTGVFEAAKAFTASGQAGAREASKVLLMVACSLGYDCTSENSTIRAYFSCATYESCPGYNLSDWIAADSESNEQYARLFQQAMLLTYEVQQGNKEPLAGYAMDHWGDVPSASISLAGK